MIYRLQTTGASLTMPTPFGFKSRLISVALTFSTAPNDQESAGVTFERGGLQVAGAFTGPLSQNAINKIYFALGLNSPSAGLASAGPAIMTGALPDIWWDQDIIVKTTSGAFGVISDFTMLYEQVPLRTFAPRAKRERE